MSRRLAKSRRTIVSRQLPTSNPTGDIDVAAACELVIAHVEGRPLAPLVDPRRAADLIGGLAALVAVLAGQLGSGPDRPEEFRALLTGIEVTSRLLDLIGQPEEPEPEPA